MHRSSVDPLQRWHDAALVLRERLQHVLHGRSLSMTMIAGSGVMDAFDPMTTVAEVSYRDLPGIPEPTVSGHAHVFRVVDVSGILVGVFGGRFHVYEGHDVSTILAPVAISRHLGVRHLLISNAAGGLHPASAVGDVMLVCDLLNATMLSLPPCLPPPPVRNRAVIDARWHADILRGCMQRSTAVRQGTYVQVTGPSYETRAEIRMARRMGADAIGMSTVLEAQYASAIGMSTAVCSMITNTLSDTRRAIVSHAEVLDAALMARTTMRVVIEAAAQSVSLPT
ncbi:MAG: purine-nucleoside phosphorylase [Bacteroidetes bacterium]|nr:purine-nucleoside phosphorylase [Bacteroidota bacterium]